MSLQFYQSLENNRTEFYIRYENESLEVVTAKWLELCATVEEHRANCDNQNLDSWEICETCEQLNWLRITAECLVESKTDNNE